MTFIAQYVRGSKSIARIAPILLALVMLAPLFAPLASVQANAQTASHSASAVARSAASLLFHEEGVYGVVFMETNGTVLYKHNADLPFVAASLYKLILMVDIYSRRERGEIAFTDLVTLQQEDFSIFEDPDQVEDTYFLSGSVGMQVPVSELMEALIAYSSNVAARAFLRMTNTINLNHIAQDMGMIDTHILVNLEEISPWPSETLATVNQTQKDEALEFVDLWGEEGVINITTPADIATFFLQLTNRELISEAVSAEMEDLLARQQFVNRIPALLPEGTRCAHKTGNLEEVVHDAGIVYGENGPTVLVALSEDVLDEDRAAAIIQRLGLIAYGETELPPMPEPSPVAADN